MMPFCCLERLGVGVGWSCQVRGNREGPQRATCTHRSRSRGWTEEGGCCRARRPEAWEAPVHEGRPPGLGLKTLWAPRAGAEEPRPWTCTDEPHGGTGASCTQWLTDLAAGRGCKAPMRDQCRLFPFLLPPTRATEAAPAPKGSLVGQQTPAVPQRVGRRGVRGYEIELLNI